jgi:hypothetical protein
MVLKFVFLFLLMFSQPEELDRIISNFGDFLKYTNKFSFVDKFIIEISATFYFYIFILYLIEKFGSEELLQKVKYKFNFKQILFLVIISILAIIILKNKELSNYRIETRIQSMEPKILYEYDSVYFINFAFDNNSDIRRDINCVYVFITLDKDSFFKDMFIENAKILPLDKNRIIICMNSFNLEIGKSQPLKLPLSLSYLKINKSCEITTTCFSKNNQEKISLKTQINLDSTKISKNSVYTVDSLFDIQTVENNIEFHSWKTEAVNYDNFQNQNKRNTSIQIIPKVINIDSKNGQKKKEDSSKLSNHEYSKKNTDKPTKKSILSAHKYSEENTDRSTRESKLSKHKYPNENTDN